MSRDESAAMSRFEREQLTGYLLGALEEPERVHLERRLASEPALAARLQTIAEQLEPLAGIAEEEAPPPGLAARTVDFVFGSARVPAATARRGMAPPEDSPRGWFNRMSAADWVVAAALLIAASVLLMPALQGSRFNARLRMCQDNLRQIGTAMMHYSEHHGGYLPFVPPEGRLASAGIYAPILFDQGLLHHPETVVCPDSLLTERSDFHVPSLEEIARATPGELAAMRPSMGGSYGYSLGHLEDGAYCGTRDLRRPHFAVVANRPDRGQPELRTANHAGQGQNVLFEDGRVGFLFSPTSLGSGDRFFLNDEGRVGPGKHRDDSVIVSSTAAPVLPGACSADR